MYYVCLHMNIELRAEVMFCFEQMLMKIAQQYQTAVNIWSMQTETMTVKPRNRVANLLRGTHNWLTNTKILVVGVGGIGCEVLKVLCKLEVGQIHILDMDTIELSNLNRQFLFKTEHKGMSKSLVARQSVLKLNPHLNIQAHHCNIKDLPLSFFNQFQFLVMALDNVQARNYVNKIGVRLNIPIVDAGTLGYKGNVTTILSGKSKCYSCQPKNAPQNVFPVCTIRMRPEKPIHCIVWAKMLFEVMFGENAENDISDMAVLQTEEESAILRRLFLTEIENIRNAKAEGQSKLAEIMLKKIKTLPEEVISSNLGRKVMDQFGGHEKVQSLQDNVAILGQSILKLREQKKLNGRVVFQKDDDEVMHFISAAANLRMHCFSIEQQTFHQVKNMAGNIIPAIASTNAIVSAIQLVQMLKLLSGQQNKLRSYFVQNQHNKLLALKLQAPLPTCTVCSSDSIPVRVECNFNEYKLGQLVQLIQENSPSLTQYSINQGSKEIHNSQEPREALLNKTIWQIAESYQLDLVITDENTSSKLCGIWMVHNEQLQHPTTSNLQKLIPKQKIQIEQQNPEQDKGDDSDFLIMDGQSSEIQIVGVFKRERDQAEQQPLDELRKKKKLE